jgi:hypothetical protein
MRRRRVPCRVLVALELYQSWETIDIGKNPAPLTDRQRETYGNEKSLRDASNQLKAHPGRKGVRLKELYMYEPVTCGSQANSMAFGVLLKYVFKRRPFYLVMLWRSVLRGKRS